MGQIILLVRASGGRERHSDECLVATTLDQQKNGFAAILACLCNGSLHLMSVANRLVVDRDDDVAGLDAGCGSRLVRIDVGNDGSLDTARQVQLLTYVRSEVGKADAEARLVGRLNLAIAIVNK